MKRALDKYFPRNGPCALHPTLYARHRLVDAIREQRGRLLVSLMREFGLSRAALMAAINSKPDDNRMTRKEREER